MPTLVWVYCRLRPDVRRFSSVKVASDDAWGAVSENSLMDEWSIMILLKGSTDLQAVQFCEKAFLQN